MSAPIIGLTTYNGENKYGHPIVALMQQYIIAIGEAGGAPILIPSGINSESVKSLFKRVDGILLTGGGDIAIDRFDGEPHLRVEGVDPNRDTVEIALVQSAAQSGKPFFGICRGFQVVNVALGGTLYTHIQDQLPGAIKHDYDSDSQRQFLAHPIRLEKGSALASIMGEDELNVNSLHHQGAKDLAPALQPAAYAPDGLVEGLELPGHPFGMAVQWHPEWLTDQPVTRRLFGAFVEAAGKD
ncbi:MAG: gamma-glutamyl-gamma-aminobutyrate hydrolase family protein [Anaerolineales bacterium]|jgi:putative glutamine amidotransferase